RPLRRGIAGKLAAQTRQAIERTGHGQVARLINVTTVKEANFAKLTEWFEAGVRDEIVSARVNQVWRRQCAQVAFDLVFCEVDRERQILFGRSIREGHLEDPCDLVGKRIDSERRSRTGDGKPHAADEVAASVILRHDKQKLFGIERLPGE